MSNSAVRLDERLRAAAFYMSEYSSAADIGADHGYLALHLLKENPKMRMLVSDISAESLMKARAHLKDVPERVSFAVADGLCAISFPVKCAAVCGMGGELIAKIIRDGKDKLQGAALVLSPNTEAELVREAIYSIGYHIKDEKIACAAGRMYVVIYAKAGAMEISEKDIYLSPSLMHKNDELTYRYYSWRRDVVATTITETEKAVKKNAERAALYQKRYAWLCEVISSIERNN